MIQNFTTPPNDVCILRLSAIGDTCHTAALVQQLQKAWPATRFTWIIGKLEAKLMAAVLPGVEFIIFDKRATAGELRRLAPLLRRRRFDLLLDLQLSLRASLLSLLVRAPIKLGFDRARARELQWFFTNARIAPATREHVLDSFMGFARACGVDPGAPRWTLDLPAAARSYAERLIPDGQATLLISPCSSHRLRDWTAPAYAKVAEHAVRRHHMRVILVGGRSAAEQRMGEALAAQAQAPLTNQIGLDTLPELLALMASSSALISPDSGPAHMATMVGLPVIGLYAATNPARSGPYCSLAWCVNKYPQASRLFLGKEAAELAWTTKIELPGVMELITVDDVCDRLDALIAAKIPA